MADCIGCSLETKDAGFEDNPCMELIALGIERVRIDRLTDVCLVCRHGASIPIKSIHALHTMNTVNKK